MTSRNTLVLTALLAVAALALGGCSDSSTPEDIDTDTTAPVVVGTTPRSDDIQVATNAAVRVTFNEDMAPASAVGQVTLSSGGAVTVEWVDERTFDVQHGTAWAEGVQVTVTVGAGLTDAAGNALASAYSFSFFTETSALLFVTSLPADGAIDVNRSANVQLQFSLSVDESSVAANVDIYNAANKVGYPFTVSSSSNSWVTLDLTEDLPAGALIVVRVGAGVHVDGSPLNTLGEAVNVDFTTGVDVDTTPPTIVALSPANGAINVASDIGALTITFSEPIDPDTFQPTAWNLELFVVIEGNDVQPVWSQGNTVLTVGLPTLPAGLEMEVAFGGYADQSGNVQSTTTTWGARVAGTADIYPMTDGAAHRMYGDWARGLAGSEMPFESGDSYEALRIEAQLNGDLRLVRYDDLMYTTPRGWQTYDRLASAINWLGFADSHNGGTPDEILFDTPVKFLPLPMVAGSWSGTTTVTVPGEGTYSAQMTGQVIGREDLDYALKTTGSPLYYKGAWKVVRSLEVTLGDEWFTTMADTTWYSPTLGPVREISHESSAARGEEPASWYRTELWRDLSTVR